MNDEFTFEAKVYYEDTDAGGVVYYANYLKYIERARTEAINSIGLSNKILKDQYQTFIIVKSCNIEFHKPAKLEDKLQIYSNIEKINKASFVMKQVIKRNSEPICEAIIELVTVNSSGKPVKIPDLMKDKLIK